MVRELKPFRTPKEFDHFDSSPLIRKRAKLEHVANARHVQDPNDPYRRLNIYEDRDGNLFYLLARPGKDLKDAIAYSKRTPWIQSVVTMALKNAANLADVLVVDSEPGKKPEERTKRPTYYSQMIWFDDVKQKPRPGERRADEIVLMLIANHSEFSGQNVKVDGEMYHFYDFANASLWSRLDEKYTIDQLSRLTISEEVAQLLLEKLSLLRERFTGEDGEKHWLAMFKRLKDAGEDITMDTLMPPEDMLKIFRENIDTCIRVIGERKYMR